jgi:hypothetical protein
MKLKSFENIGFQFSLTFVNGRTLQVNIQPLLGAYLSEQELTSARIDPDWGCLEFCDGAVDIEPMTLYRYAVGLQDTEAA